MRNKVVTKVFGGLGNQLFCYACGYAVAKENEGILIIDTTQQDNDAFRKVDIVRLNIEYNSRISIKKGIDVFSRAVLNNIRLKSRIGIATQIIKEKECYKYDSQVFNHKGKDIYLDGYWQSYRYFEKYRDDLCRMFVPKIKFSDKYAEINRSILANTNTVAIHVRRGDYLSIGCSIGMQYYEEAILKMKSLLGNSTAFYIFSDDATFAHGFARQHSDIHMRVIDNEGDNQTIEDFFLMSKCHHFIIANSSFSWWAAWLCCNARKIVICPEVSYWTGDFYPVNWEKIKAKVTK